MTYNTISGELGLVGRAAVGGEDLPALLTAMCLCFEEAVPN
jgi:hypothetical protein